MPEFLGEVFIVVAVVLVFITLSLGRSLDDMMCQT